MLLKLLQRPQNCLSLEKKLPTPSTGSLPLSSPSSLPLSERACCIWIKPKKAPHGNVLQTPARCVQNTTPWTSSGRRVGGVATARGVDCIEICAAVKGLPAENCGDLTIDISQAASRGAWTLGCPCLTTSSHLYSYRLQRMLLAEEHLLLEGFPASLNLGSLTQHAIRSLAGEAMAPPSVGMALMPLLLSMPSHWQYARPT